MGESSSQTITTKKKKKKGRPSLIELQKRSIKQQQQQQKQQLNPNLTKTPNSSNPRSNRRKPNLTHDEDNSNSNSSENEEEEDEEEEEEDDDDERQLKKHKLLLGLNNSRKRQNEVVYDAHKSKRQRITDGSNQLDEKVLKATDTLHGSPVESGPTTDLPDKKLLVFILDRLQKKDTYGVFSEPVDPEELPDYREIVQNPMDFGTLRKKLDDGAYLNLEQFEVSLYSHDEDHKDVFLICTNAMEYNSQDTIYYRQARSMLEMAKKDFENLRQESGDDSETPPQPKVVRRGRPPGKSIKKTLEIPSDCVGPELTPAGGSTGGEILNSSGTNGYNLRKATISQKFRPDPFGKLTYGSHEGYSGYSYDCESEFPASVVRAVMKYGMKHFPVDENRRDTYTHSLDGVHVPSVLTTFDGEPKQLLPVGLSSEHGYARSLARFAANLGPTAWKIASKKIQNVLPPGVEFGPGWVGEKNAGEPQPLVSFSGNPKYSNTSMSDDYSSKLMSPPTSCSNTAVSNRLQTREDLVEASKRELNTQCESSSSGPAATQLHQKSSVDKNGFNVGFGFNGQMGMARLPNSQAFGMHPIRNTGPPAHLENSSRLYSENLSASGSGTKSWQGHQKQDPHVFPPDLNVGFLSPVSPTTSNVQIGSPQQPDLALQL
ncbi:hypothetical protein ACFE04_012529 [Oxalis oulophora]